MPGVLSERQNLLLLHPPLKARAKTLVRVISSVGLERCFDRAEVSSSNLLSPTSGRAHTNASPVLYLPHRGVAQPGRVHAWGACGRRFKSCRPDYKKPESPSRGSGFFAFGAMPPIVGTGLSAPMPPPNVGCIPLLSLVRGRADALICQILLPTFVSEG
jgi:hypothetical protein